MTTDTPESLSVLIKIVSNHWDGIYTRESVVEALTRYAESLERTCEWRYAYSDCHKTQCGMFSSTLCETVAGYMKFCPYCGARMV